MRPKYPNNLLSLMERAGMGVTQLAREVGTSKQNISRWAKGERRLPLEWTPKLAPLLGAKPQDLIFDGDDGPPLQFVPVLSWVSAGRLADASTQVPLSDVPLLAFADLGHGDFFALEVRGDSMDRQSPDGSIIIVNRDDRQLISGKAYVFSVRGEATYKRWRPRPVARLDPYSTNPNNEPIFVESEEALGVVGRVRRTLLDL